MPRHTLMIGALLIVSLMTGVGCRVFIPVARDPALPRVTGVVQEPRSGLLRIMTKEKEIREIRIDKETHYTKWLTHQPWTIDKYVDGKSLTVGRCINIVLRTDDLRAARLIQIALDRPGSFEDPCRSIR